MTNEAWYEHFMGIISERYPKKAELAIALMDLLNIEREAAYRRLRKDVIFPMHEIVKIAAAWNISIDEIIGVKSDKVLFQMHPMNYIDPSKEDMDFIKKRVKGIERLNDYPNSEYILVCNNMSRSLSAGFDILYKFNIFKWAYGYANNYETFSHLVVPEVLCKEVAKFYRSMRDVGNTCYILNSSLIEDTIREIHFFHSIFLINDEEKKLLKKSLHSFLDYLWEIASNGCFPETKNKVQVYVSMFNINTNYSYFNTGQYEMCRIHPFNMYDLISTNSGMIENFKSWMQKKKRTSIQISEVDERTRIEYFTKQRQIVDSL
jgi:hypothetical protein